MNPIEEAQNQAVEATRLQHQQWLGYPGTRNVLKALENHKEEFTNLLTAHATNTNVSDATIRHYAVSLKTTEYVIQLMTREDVLIHKLNPKQQTQ